ncbi:putative RNA helicase [Rosa chinensis]|uniref:RNA helicase n=1 Tax=Rosa chinensis TaxID=74649 RepID=A0A2P6QLL1_ROSCH|nr:putative RNA helicase [Rosa chinensis]
MGSGKTTQVPQFILDDMIQSGRGGHCNIICTQPWRIAAISVANRVADERCEPSPGSNGSLVGYQVRLDNASNEKTKLLFCTTDILLRKFVGDRNLTGITHVIVDEVHERSLLGDFLLIVLKNLIEKQSALNTPKLKVILMSATVDSNLFSNYFGGCPVITAEGRTHPVTTSYDKKHTEREFGVGDWVYLKLQPYKQHSMHKGEFHKLSQRYYGPFQVVERVGKVAYRLQLPVTAKIHDVFHVSLLKKKLGDLISAQPQLPHIIDPENPKWEPFAVLDRRVLMKRGAVINQWLVQCRPDI